MMKNQRFNFNLYISRVVFVMILVFTSIPLFNGYIISGGEMSLWLGRIGEVREGLLQGKLVLFPTLDCMNAYGGYVKSVHSNLWLVLPGLFRALGVSMVVVQHVYFFLVQILTLVLAVSMFRMLFQERIAVIVGTLFYMTCPYRIYLLYDAANFGRIVVWMLIPALVLGVAGVYRYGYRTKYLFIGGISLAGIGYADCILFFVALGIILLSAMWYRKVNSFIIVGLGSVLFLPGLMYLAKYLFTDNLDTFGIPLGDIAVRGYHFGQFFSSFAFRTGLPGMGLALFGGLILLCWLQFTEHSFNGKNIGFYVMISLMFSILSLTAFPWGILQRLGTPFLKLIPLMETPAVLFGVANVFFCILGAFSIQEVRKQKNTFVRVGFPVMIGIAAIAVCVYICNMITYTRMPMEI